MADDVVVLRNGRIEEFGQTQDVYQNPKSEYMRELLELTPILPVA